MQEEKQIFTLKQVVTSIKKTIAARFQQNYWVKAELHKLNRFPSGHAFPELVYHEDGQMVAQMRGVIWKNDFIRINKQFIEVVKEPFKEGLTLLLLVRVQYDEKFGIGLQILDIDPMFSLGELHKEKEETLKKLNKNGLLNKNHELPFPLLPKRLAIISADTSKGLSDFREVLDKYKGRFNFFSMLFPAALQGDVAIPSIQNQLARIQKVKDHFDVVLIIRGGGDEVGMTCYNNYSLCEKIATFPLPILTGIGHSTNLTVAEMTAFHNAITPTALAQYLIAYFEAFETPLLNYPSKIKQLLAKHFAHENALFQQQFLTFQMKTMNFISKENNLLWQKWHQFQQSNQKVLSKEKNQISNLNQALQIHSKNHLQNEKNKTLVSSEKLSKHSQLLIDNQKSLLQSKEEKVHILSPQQILKRGYAIVRKGEKTIGTKNLPKVGEILEIETLEWALSTKLEHIKKKENE